MDVDLNADVGESFGAYAMGSDAALLPWITSASVAAGFHAGDPSVLRRTVRLAGSHGVAIGAHPGLPDLPGFGRRAMAVSPQEAEDLVLYQVAAVAGVAAAEGLRLRHVKPHGALYNVAARDPMLAAAIARAVAAFDAGLLLFGPPGSALLEAGRRSGLRVVPEVFADRAYLRDGGLAPRGQEGSLITDVSILLPRAVRMVRQGVVRTIEGDEIEIQAGTICVHGDTPGAADLGRALRQGLAVAGVEVRAPHP